MSKLQNRGFVSILSALARGSSGGGTGTLGGVVGVGNATKTILPVNTFTSLNLGVSASIISNAVGWTLTNATTGELTYQGTDPFTGILTVSLSIIADAGNTPTVIRAVKNGSALSDNARSSESIGTADRELSFLSPLEVVNGDTVRLQVKTDDGEDVTISKFTIMCLAA